MWPLDVLIVSSFLVPGTYSTIVHVSKDVSAVICKQLKEFSDTSAIPEAAKTKPADSSCGWYKWERCGDKKCGAITQKECTGQSPSENRAAARGDDEGTPAAASSGNKAGSTDASPHKYPSIIMISNRGQQICSGALIDPNWIITAAHCLTSDVADQYRIVGGLHDQNNRDGTEVEIVGHAVFKHEQYDETSLKNDIALIKLAQPFEENDKVKHVALPEPGSSPSGPSIIVGWSQLRVDESVNKAVLQETIASPAQPCDSGVENTLCDTVTSGSCAGDEGGPLYTEANGKRVLLGIASSRVGCAAGGKPGVYVAVSAYVDWIKEKMDTNPGAAPAKRGMRIVGGKETLPHKYPSIAMMKFQGGHACGGTIIDEQWILTAAHCFGLSKDPADYAWVAAEHNKNQHEGPEQESQAVGLYPHKNYDEDNFENDIAMVKISPPFKLSAKVTKGTLPPKDYKPSGHLWVAGWGAVKEAGDTSAILKEVDLPIIEANKCKDLLSDPNLYTDKIICTGYEEGGKDACQGDSGGPLYHVNGGQQIVVGVVSWGIGCARKDSPGVFTRVTHYLKWIQQTMKSGGRSIGIGPSVLRGKVASYKFPSLAALKYQGTYACVATIINREWVITAASCIKSKRTADYEIVVGENDLNKVEDTEQTISAKEILINDGYSAGEYANDIALINVAQPFEFNQRVQAAYLPNRLFHATNLTLQLVGWGLKDLSVLMGPMKPQSVEVQSFDHLRCHKLRSEGNDIRFNMFCTTPTDLKACYGDRGSPVYHVEGIRHVLAGVRTGHSCQKAESVEVFAQVPSYMKWILTHTNLEYSGRGISHFEMGGQPAFLTTYPATVLIMARGKAVCGGVLISPKYVLTSCYCVSGNPASVLKIIAGDDNVLTSQGAFREEAEVREIYEHSQYNPETSENDIGLLLIDPPFAISEKVKPISYGSAANPTKTLVSVGWGVDTPKATTLSEIGLRRSSDCGKHSKHSGGASSLCVVASKTGDRCRGDPGGPVYDVSDGIVTLVGINAGVKACGRDGNPGPVAKVGDYSSWIRRRIAVGLNIADSPILPIPKKFRKHHD